MNIAHVIDRWIHAEAKILHLHDHRCVLPWSMLAPGDVEYYMSEARKIVEPQLLAMNTEGVGKAKRKAGAL